MKRSGLDKALFDLDTWPTLSTEEMAPAQAQFAQKRIAAIRLYLEGRCHATIKSTTGMDRRRVCELLARCIALHPDGRIFGFRACRFYAHVKLYTRVAPSPAGQQLLKYGHSGLMGRVLRRFPHILQTVVETALKSRSSEFTESTIRIDKLHALFLRLCRESGLGEDEYPFNVVTQGERALSRRLKVELASRDMRRLVSATFGADAARRLGSSDAAVRIGARRQCYARVEFDGHRIDALMVIEIADPAGGEPVRLVIERIWLLVVIDVTSRAVLGYHVAFERHYSGEDVLLCLENAILPWKPRALTIPGLKYPPGSGLPSGVIPELAYARWGEIALDNDMSNCSRWVWERVRESIGCILSPGPVKTPQRRDVVERFFRSLEENGFHRLVTTSGSSPADPRRRNPQEMALRYNVRLDEILDLIDVIIAQYNSTPTRALKGRSPLDYLRFAVARNSFFIRHIPEAERSDFSLTITRQSAVVRGNLRKGYRPYIEFKGVRYYSPKLNNSPLMIGQRVTIECRTRDLRTIKLFLPNGEEFGELTVAQAWAAQAHDLRTRQAILRCIGRGRIARRGQPDVIQAYIDHKMTQAKSKKKSRNELAHVLRIQRQASSLVPEQPAEAGEPESLLERRKAPRVSLLQTTLNY